MSPRILFPSIYHRGTEVHIFPGPVLARAGYGAEY
jgi:hypothetical protein